LPGQCRTEGKCHHPASEQQAESEWDDNVLLKLYEAAHKHSFYGFRRKAEAILAAKGGGHADE
jgi:hypothetical protein